MSFEDFGGRRPGGGGGWGGGYQDRPAYGSSSGNDQLSHLVSNNIKQINYNVAQITKMVNALGVPNKDSHDLRIAMRDLIDATRKLALDTNKILKDFNIHNDQDAKKLQGKLKTDFQNCLERFQEISKIAGKKASSSVPPKPHQQSGGGIGPAMSYEDDRDDNEQHGLLESQKRQQLLQIEGEREYQSAIIREREEGIKQIETTIHEVNEIFVDLAALVQEQGSMIDNIESHIDSSVASTSKGVVELRQAQKYMDSTRTKMCCIALVILIIVAIVVVALVLGISFGIKK